MSGAVYQPTTVQYETNAPQERWQDRPISFLATSCHQTVRRRSCLHNRTVWPTILVISSLLFFILGILLLIHGAIGYSDTLDTKEDVYLMVTVAGALIFAISILIFVFFLRLTRRICWRNAKDHLIAAQYAPVSEVAYQPTNTTDDTEQSKLMPQECDKLTNEDTDRMVERDPRIVLRPLNPPAHEDT